MLFIIFAAIIIGAFAVNSDGATTFNTSGQKEPDNYSNEFYSDVADSDSVDETDDPIVSCEFKSGAREMKSSECDALVDCQIGDNWVPASKENCDSAQSALTDIVNQKNYQYAETTPSFPSPLYEDESNFEASVKSSKPTPYNIYGGSSSYAQIGDTLFGSGGDSYTRIGDTTFGSDGSTHTQIGDSLFSNDGTSYQRIGDTVFRSDGTSFTQIGETVFGSDGSTITGIGDTIFIDR